MFGLGMGGGPLLPRPVVDGGLVGGAGGDQAVRDCPVVGVLEALAGVGLGVGVEDAPGVDVGRVDEAFGLLYQVVEVGRWVAVQEVGGAAFRPEHGGEGRSVELVARRLA